MESTCQTPQIQKLLVKSMEDMDEDAQLKKGKNQMKFIIQET